MSSLKCMNKDAECQDCHSKKDLYASVCTHIDPLCLKCARKYADESSACTECNEPITQVIRRFRVKRTSQKGWSGFVGILPPEQEEDASEDPDMSDVNQQKLSFFPETDNQKRWACYRDGAREIRFRIKSNKSTRPLILEDLKADRTFKGKCKLANLKRYFMAQFEPEARIFSETFSVYPLKSWYEFSEEKKPGTTYSLDEAEEIMEARKNKKKFEAYKMKKGNEGISDNEQKKQRTQKSRISDFVSKNDDGDDEDDLPDSDNESEKSDELNRQEGEDLNEEIQDDDLDFGFSDSDEELYPPSDNSDYDSELDESGKELRRTLRGEKEDDSGEKEEEKDDQDGTVKLKESKGKAVGNKGKAAVDKDQGKKRKAPTTTGKEVNLESDIALFKESYREFLGTEGKSKDDVKEYAYTFRDRIDKNLLTKLVKDHSRIDKKTGFYLFKK